MKRWVAIAALLLGVSLSFPAAAQIQYFGYVYNGEDDDALAKTKSYTNFAHTAAEIPQDPAFLAKVNNINSRGLKVTIDLGKIFWCGAPEYNYLCSDWTTRWSQWKTYNTSILTSNKVLAVAVRDEALLFGASLNDVQTVAATIKTDYPWIKIFYTEAACKVAWDQCGKLETDGNNGFNNVTTTLPSVDWIGIDAYSIHPQTDSTFQYARQRMQTKFPGKKWIYIGDGWWEQGHADAFYPNDPSYMATIAQEWYDMARADANAVLFGFFLWPSNPDAGETGSRDLPCNVLQKHTEIGRAITGKTRGAPIGTFSVDSLGVATGWTCTPGQTVCEGNSPVYIYANGAFISVAYPPNDGTFQNLQCGTDTAFKFKVTLPRSTGGQSITAVGTGSPSATIPSSCPQTPACTWTSHIKYFGYSGSADDTTNRGLDETKGFTNFSHIVQGADPASTFVRDRVQAMNARGLKATIDLGQLLWCGTNYRSLCSDWQSRWSTWKTTNQTILTSDKVLALVPRAEPFNYAVNMSQYDQVTAFIKADPLVGSWVKLWLIEAACVVANGNCGAYPGSNWWNSYTGTLPSVDWIGVNAYALHPNTDSTYQSALNKVKTRYASKPRVYVMDGFWDSAHASAFGSNINAMSSIATEYYNVAHNDPGAILLGIYLWNPTPGWTTSSQFPCSVLSTHRQIGREITLKQRANTGLPIGRLEDIPDYSGGLYGYACDPDGTICEDPQIDIYADGILAASTTNYPNRNDYVTNAQCGVGVAYRFRYTLPGWTSGRSITTVARDLNSGTVTLPSNCPENPACVWFSANYEAKGYMEAISPSGVAAGWVCDPDAPTVSTKVRLALDDGTPIGTYTTNLANEQAVADECNGGYLHRFSVQLPAWAHWRTIRAYSQDVIYGETQIPWLCDPGGYECTWY